jgi:Na+-translocating ferredoxin:NAD+ oxidoreductase RNF subunit RnfB
MLTPFIIAAIGLVCGIIIYIVYVKMPIKVEGIEKTEELSAILPGMNCGACGYPGCFGLAQALAKDPDMISRAPCSILLQDAERLASIGEALGKTIDASAMQKRALVRCAGNSDIIYHYSGVNSCKAADQLLSGYKKCPYACLGLGDCAAVCPQNAISIDPENHTASVDWDKCTGCGLCVAECPKNLIDLVSATTKIAFRCNYTPLRNIPGREKCQSGCIHCRKCFNACQVDAITWNKEKAIPEFDPVKCTLCLSCIEACPNAVLAKVSNELVPDKVPA